MSNLYKEGKGKIWKKRKKEKEKKKRKKIDRAHEQAAPRLTGNVVHNHSNSWVSDIRWDEAAEPLLAGRVP